MLFHVWSAIVARRLTVAIGEDHNSAVDRRLCAAQATAVGLVDLRIKFATESESGRGFRTEYSGAYPSHHSVAILGSSGPYFFCPRCWRCMLTLLDCTCHRPFMFELIAARLPAHLSIDAIAVSIYICIVVNVCMYLCTPVCMQICNHVYTSRYAT